MSGNHAVRGIVFADIVGSTRLFEEHGNAEAHRLVSLAIELLTQVTTDHSGTLIKTIGDEVMVSFEDGQGLFEAVSRMPSVIIDDPDLATVGMKVKVGFHAGEVVLKDDDVFGDAVNVAARLTGLAKASQVLTTRDTVNTLPQDAPFAFRDLGPARVRGRREVIDLVELLWQTDSGVATAQVKAYRPTGHGWLTLEYQRNRVEIDESRLPFVMGRGDESDLVVSHEAVSREHAKIRLGSDRFVLIDCSTNGTYVSRDPSEEPVRIHREQVPLSGRGVIGLGVDPSEVTDHHEAVVRFAFTR